MNIYTFLTPSHSILYNNYFLKTLPKNFNLNCLEIQSQICSSASFYQPGWSETTINKIRLLIQACEENMGNYFVYSDVDVQFFNQNILDILLNEIENKDIACQDDNPLYCTGFFICKANNVMLKLFNKILDDWDPKGCDQKMLNKYLYLCKYKKLSKQFFTVGQITKKVWTEDQDFELPQNIAMHHANWTIGIENKIKLLDLVKLKHHNTYIH